MEKTAKLEAIKNWMKSKKIKQKSIAETLGVTPTVINNLLAGRVEFGRKTARAWNEKFGFDPDFLMRGEGQLFHHEKNLKEQISELAIKNSSADMAINSVEAILLVDCLRSGDKEWITATNCDEDGKKIFYLLGKSERPDFHDRFARWLMAGCPYV